jgi:hypothetical protein
MTDYLGTISYSADLPSQGDGDENDFYIFASGEALVSLSVGVVSLSGAVDFSPLKTSGYTPDDQDGDNDAFSNSATGGGVITGTTSDFSTGPISLSDGGTVTFKGQRRAVRPWIRPARGGTLAAPTRNNAPTPPPRGRGGYCWGSSWSSRRGRTRPTIPTNTQTRPLAIST